MNAMASARASFVREYPGAYFLDRDDTGALTAYLSDHAWLDAGEDILSVSKAGEGNMNLSLRVKTSRRSFIVKQGRPWVEKYPAIAAPWGRTAVEACFYRQVGSDPEVADRMPRLIGDEPGSQILVLDDLGEASDFTNVYSGSRVPEQESDVLADYLGRLHVLPVDRSLRKVLANREMRRLNHEHIFRLPLAAENDLDLDRFNPGLNEVAEWFKKDRAYLQAVAELGELYLSDGAVLLHGDYYPGSWLRTAGGMRVIDPEFCFLGPAEFDVGVMAGHFLLSDHDIALMRRVFKRYEESRRFDKGLALRFAGVEIMRRLIGVAQLPLTRDLGWKQRLLERSRRLVLDGADLGL